MTPRTVQFETARVRGPGLCGFVLRRGSSRKRDTSENDRWIRLRPNVEWMCVSHRWR